MAQVIYASRALTDLDRLADFLLETEPAAALATVELIAEAVEILAKHPFVGRPAEDGLRELVISRGRSGHLALYGYEEADDTVLVPAVRHQPEAGYLIEPD